MERNLGKLAGLAAFALMMARLGRLLEGDPASYDWWLILLASALLGAVGWWLLTQVIADRRLVLTVFTLGGLLLLLRISVPHGLTLGFLPSVDTARLVAAEISDSIRLIRFGVAPILATPGVVSILAGLMWAISALYVAGMTSGRSVLMILPSLVAYLQFAIFDRFHPGPIWMVASASAIALGISAVAVERSPETGRARDPQGRIISKGSPALSLMAAGLVAAIAVVGTTAAAGLVPDQGNIRWRTSSTGYGTGGGGFSPSRLVDLRQSIISRNNDVVFRATLSEGAPPGNRIYWRVETLDNFDGIGWRPSDTSLSRHLPGEPVSGPSQRYQGTTVDIVQRVQIDALGSELVPTAGVTTEIHEPDAENAIAPRAFQVTYDASLFYAGGTRLGHTYQIRTVYPAQEADLVHLATGRDGELSPTFAGAAEAGLFPEETPPGPRVAVEPADLDSFTRLPDTTPPGIFETAARVTIGATTDFEKAWMLQRWFRDSGSFAYSTEVSTGHSALVLDDWLNDPDSLNYRTGYCEQFAASMAVLGRALGIPSRVVWGFTPGTVTVQDGIEVVEVRDTNAHAWVEMWMDGFGWVTFEPTPRGEFLPPSATSAFDPAEFLPQVEAPDPLVTTPLGVPDLDLLRGFPIEPPPAQQQQALPWWLLMFPALVFLASATPLAKTLRRRRRIRQIRKGDITAAWDEIVDRLTDLGREVKPSMTPIEVAEETHYSLLPLAQGYSAAIYGGKTEIAGESDLTQVEDWLTLGFDGMERARAAVNPRSLLRRRR